MPDIFDGDDDLTFWENMGQEPEPEQAAPAEDTAVQEPEAEVAPADPADTAEPEPEATQDDRPRDDKGRFVPRNLEVDDPDIQKYLDKYQGDPVKALKAAVEAQSTIGRLGDEVGELRKLREQLDALNDRVNQPPPTQITEDLIDRDPARAAQLAYEQNNPAALDYAIAAWKADDPFAAALWVSERRQEQRERAYQERIQKLEQTVVPAAHAAEFEGGIRHLVEQDPSALDRIREGIPNIPQEVASTLYSLLDQGTPEQKIGAFKALAELTRQGPAPADTPALEDQARQLAHAQAVEAERAIAEAGVVSATATRSDPPKKAADYLGDEWASMESPYKDGWNI